MQQFVDDDGNPIPEDKVTALPTKRFFMLMLTRDIELEDAIMDLLDNCIDGIHRQKNSSRNPTDNLYKGYFGNITINKDEFILTDNCGGIPIHIAKEYAFKMGRSENYHTDDDLETIGMYGIGMKRAIFKMGVSAEVVSHTPTDTFKVSIPENWSASPDWYFDFASVDHKNIQNILPNYGTSLKVTNLFSNISSKFGDEEKFLTDLRDSLQKHYGYIISQGFMLTVNDIVISEVDISILTSTKRSSQSIKPYFYSNTIDDIKVDIIIGFYREPASSNELDDELEGSFAKRRSENAGITILCNDRIVLHADKTYMTGWGDSQVPQYHTQFINIAGVVHFRAKNSVNLPVTTTKRGLDTSSKIYGPVKNKIKEGIKYFTDFTNKWKTDTPERATLFQDLKPINAFKLSQSKSDLIEAKASKRNDTALYQLPDLPKPENKQNKDIISVNFKKHKNQIAAVRNAFFEESNATPNEIGAWCFDQFYSQTQQ